MGGFEFMPGVEQAGFPVYRQADSNGTATRSRKHFGDSVLLYRWKVLLFKLHKTL